MKNEHMRDEHVIDAAQDVVEDVTQDVAEDVLGAAEDGSSSVSGGKIIIITPVAYPQLPPTPTPPKVSSSAVSLSSRQALFERLVPFVGAAGPLAMAVDSRRAGM